MTEPRFVFGALLLALGLAGCASLEPRLPNAEPAIAAAWPLPSTRDADVAGQSDIDATAAALPGWREFFRDPGLAAAMDAALANNRDLRIALLNVERARAQYRIQRADRFPSAGLDSRLARIGGEANGGTGDRYSVDLGLAQFELDLFGRVRSLSGAALQRYLATEQAQHSAQITLIADVASTWLTLAADQEQHRIALAALANHEATFKLTEQRHTLGAVSALDVAQARTVVETSRSDAARFAGQVAQGRNALTLLMGHGTSGDVFPSNFDANGHGLIALSPGLPSEALLRRPDVLAAEHALRAANANIGAARAAFFPSITLTGSVGRASAELDALFDGGSGAWSFVPSIQVPIFQGGRLKAALGVAQVDRDIALAEYERAIQAAFRDVADALALESSLSQQRVAQEALVAAAEQAETLSEARYRAGQDSYLVLLDAQRTLYAARQTLIGTRQAEQINRVSLFRALGGGWEEGAR